MRRTFLFLNTLLLAGVCLAQEQSTENQREQAGSREQQGSEQAEASPRNPALDNAPMAVKEQVMRHAAAQDLKELGVQELNGANVYEAVFEGRNTETRLRMDESGAPISMHIAGVGGPAIDEAAGARRDEQPRPETQPQAQPIAPTDQQPSVPTEIRDRIQQQLGEETPLLEVQPKVFYQLNIRQNGEVQQIWADESGTVLREQQ